MFAKGVSLPFSVSIIQQSPCSTCAPVSPVPGTLLCTFCVLVERYGSGVELQTKRTRVRILCCRAKILDKFHSAV